MKPMEKRGVIKTLPREMLLCICYQLGPLELYNFMHVCTTTRNLCLYDEKLWGTIFQRHWPKIHKALLIPPVKWKFASIESRVFSYLLAKHIKRKRRLKMRNSFSNRKKLSSHNILDGLHHSEIDEITTKMKVYSKNLLFQKAACYAIRRLCYYPSDAEDKIKQEVENNVTIFGRKKVVKLILSGIKNFQKDPEFLAGAFCALGNLSSEFSDENDNSKLITSKGGIERILKSMKNHPTSSDVIDYGCFLLKNLALINDANKMTIAEKGGVQTVVSIMQGNTSDSTILCWCFDLLAVLTRGLFSRADFKNQKAINRDVVSLANYVFWNNSEKSELLACSFRCLRNIAQLDEPNTVMFDFKQVIVQLMKKHEKNALIQVEGALLLFFMYFRREDAQDEKVMLVDLVVTAMKRHTMHRTLQQFATAMLCDLVLLGGPLREYIKKKGAGKLIIKAMENKMLSYNEERFWNEVIVEFDK